MNIEDIQRVWDEAECLHDGAQIQAAIAQMASDIGARLRGENPVCLCIVTGGIVIAGQLLPLLDFPMQLDYIHATRYRGGTEGAPNLSWRHYPDIKLEGRTVLVLDDILDEGLTLQGVLDYCREQGARTAFSAVLTDKQRPRAKGGTAQADFTGLVIPNRYVFGYGLDYQGYLRNANGIYAVRGM